MPMTTEVKKISNTTRWCCDGMALRPCKYKANEGSKSCCREKCRAKWSTEKKPLPKSERWREEQRSYGDRRNAWLRSMARGAREEVAWNGYNNTEEGPALFFGRQPGRAAPDGRN